MLKILLTNDDGIASDGLMRLAKAAAQFGDVWVVAPDGQRSAASHCITLHKAIDVFPYPHMEGISAFSCSGTPADCVRIGALAIMPDKPDVVLSGINYGYNVASDIQYSATAGAAFEASFQGCIGIALSEGASGCHEVSDAYISKVLEELIRVSPGDGMIWNVNFPDCPIGGCKGILRERAASRGAFFRDSYIKKESLEAGGLRYMVKGEYNEDAESGTDFSAVLNQYISIGKVNNVGYHFTPAASADK